MYVDKIFEPDFWLAGSFAASQSEIRLENWKDFNIRRKADGLHLRLGNSCDWWIPNTKVQWCGALKIWHANGLPMKDFIIFFN